MHEGRMIFSQLMDFFPRYEFDRCVRNYRGNYRTRTFSCFTQLLCMTFAQLTFRESLRDIETCLGAVSSKLYHVGIRHRVSRSTLADANEKRDWRIYRDFAGALIKIARELYLYDEFGVQLDRVAYVLDSTTIDLCLSLFPWARFRKRKGAIKLHTLLDLRGNIPVSVRVTHGKVHDLNILDELTPEPGAFYIMDKAYTDFRRLYRLTQALAFFVIRAKVNLDYRRRNYRMVDKNTGLRSDQTILLAGPKSSQLYPTALRRISYYDEPTNKRLVFLTNNFELPALTIPQLYQRRWQVELFFKWIKQHLRIKAFFGTTPNAVKTQVWIAIGVYVLVAIIKKKLAIERKMSEILQILSITLFDKTDLYQTLIETDLQNLKNHFSNQLTLFDF
jgi:hypothetical protein